MAAVSAPHAADALTPPSSSHGSSNSWSYAAQNQNQTKSRRDVDLPASADRNALASQTNGISSLNQSPLPDLTKNRAEASTNSSKPAQAMEAGSLAPARINTLARKDSNPSESGSAPDSLIDLYGSRITNKQGISSTDSWKAWGSNNEPSNGEDPDQSSWIHRDKLARIESQELQAAGIILPRTRAPSRSSRRERSSDQQGNGVKAEQHSQFQKLQRIEPEPVEEVEVEDSDISWDLRRPEEVAEEANGGSRDNNFYQKGTSRIPIYKTSPLPIPLDYLERDTPTLRTRSNGFSGDEDAISYPKTRSRSQSSKTADDPTSTPTPAKRLASDTPPAKKTAVTSGARKGSAAATRVTSAQSRPKTRVGSKDNTNSRPPTRSGEAGSTGNPKRPEGDPPWLSGMYKPDPRLPPDQQLLPTVAKRLQQEQWEKDGKFGNVYDKEFRPLNDEEFPQPETATQTAEGQTLKPDGSSEWPLRIPKSPTLSTGRPGTSGGYSTMPKIQDVPASPLSARAVAAAQPLQVQEPPRDAERAGCGCCIVM